MKIKYKLVEELQISDLKENPVWQYCNKDEVGETAVSPIKKIPVVGLTGKLIGTQMQLANSSYVWAIIGNVDVDNPKFTEHFITISIEKGGKWFTLARYHDSDYPINGPEALAKFLCLDINQIFPITYDITKLAKGNIASLSGKISKEPKEKLSRSEIIAMAVPDINKRTEMQKEMGTVLID